MIHWISAEVGKAWGSVCPFKRKQLKGWPWVFMRRDYSVPSSERQESALLAWAVMFSKIASHTPGSWCSCEQRVGTAPGGGGTTGAIPEQRVVVSKLCGVGPASPLLSLTWCPCASSPVEQHPAKVQQSAGLVRKRLYALLSQGWWERGSEGKTNKHWLIPAPTGIKEGWGIPFPSLLPGASCHCWRFKLSFWTAAQHGPPALLVRRLTTGAKRLCLSFLMPV